MRRALVAGVLVLGATALVGFSGASFSSSSANPANSLSSGSVGVVSNLTAAASGHDVALSWTAASNAASYVIRGGTSSSSSCTSVTYTQLGTSTTTTYTDAGRYTPQGSYYCYSVQSVNHSFTNVAANPTAAGLLGVVATTVTLSNAASTSGCSNRNGSGYLDCGDRIVIDFNQPMSPATGATVCGDDGQQTIVLGYTGPTGSTICDSTQGTPTIGTLTGVDTTGNARFSAVFTWSSNNTRLTIDVDNRASGTSNTQISSSGFWTFRPSSALKSATGSFAICSSGSACQPRPSGAF